MRFYCGLLAIQLLAGIQTGGGPVTGNLATGGGDPARPPKHFSHPDRIRYDGSCMTIDGKDVFIYSGSFHYFRVPRALWRDRFRKIKAAGFNTVETYVPWNWHERQRPDNILDTSKFDFTELKAWLRMAQDEFGLYTIVRPGPFLCAEWSGGGYPRWLNQWAPGKKDLWLRSADPEHIRWSLHWFDAVCKALAPEQITRKPRGGKGIIMVQIENEYDAFGCDHKEDFLRALYRSATSHGIDVPIFTCLTSQCRASKDPELSQVFDCDNYYVGLTDAPSCAYRMQGLRRVQPDAPGFVTELQGGWFSTVTGRLSEEHYSDARHFKAIGLMSLLGGATGINYYMLVGGTHFAGWGARGMTTSYDYNAAIGENGDTGSKYDAAASIGEFIHRFGGKLVRAEGGPCRILHAAKGLSGGIRIAPDGTRFVFVCNTDTGETIRGRVTIVPGAIAKPAAPMFNVDQNGNKVLVQTAGGGERDTLHGQPFDIDIDLPPLDAQVLVIPPGAVPDQGEWWFRALQGHWWLQRPGRALPDTRNSASVRIGYDPAPVRIGYAIRKNDPVIAADWKRLPGVHNSLSELGINDFRYSLYLAQVTLDTAAVRRNTCLLFNMYTRDIVSVQVNGKMARRLFPEHADAQTWLTRNAYDRIRPDEYDNRFDVAGLLRSGDNEIYVVYENLGHAHGYVPMEELNGIREGGLGASEAKIDLKLNWQYAADMAGVSKGWTSPDFHPGNWEKISLDTLMDIPRKGNNIQPHAAADGLMTWYRVEFNLPAEGARAGVTWNARINASGNGYMWLNGHNIGRHWETGPQREFYLPECWLKFGKKGRNVLVMGLRQTINGAMLRAVEIAPYPERK